MYTYLSLFFSCSFFSPFLGWQNPNFIINVRGWYPIHHLISRVLSVLMQSATVTSDDPTAPGGYNTQSKAT